MKIRVWDLPTRIFHWLLVSSYAGAFVFSRDESFLEYHKIAGYAAIGLVMFRIVWGFAGNDYARFSGFVRGFNEVMAYLKGLAARGPKRYLGHNPAVGWMILAMLAIVFVISITGIIAYGGEEGRGIFAGIFSYRAGAYASSIHGFLAYASLLMIIVHVGAALTHDFIFRENIILAMITGQKEDEGDIRLDEAKKEWHPALRLAFWLIVTVIAALGLVILRPLAKQGSFKPEPVAKAKIPAGFHDGYALWMQECATSCHNAFHPTLLPAASWTRLMQGLSGHFGDDASLDARTMDKIRGYLVMASSDTDKTEASRKMLASIGKGEAPMRITETGYWIKKHSSIQKEVFMRSSIGSMSNCLACHPGAEVGSFDDKDIHIPD